jgi:signal transduction histidine kinase
MTPPHYRLQNVSPMTKISFFLPAMLLFFFGFAKAQSITDCSELDLNNRIYSPEFHWDFFWKKYLNPKQSAFNNESISIIGYWSNNGFPILGFGTYRTRLMLPKKHAQLSIFFSRINSVYELWLNGVMVSAFGNMNESSVNSDKLRSVIISIPADVEQVDLLIHTRNYYRPRGGISKQILIGSQDSMLAELNVRRGSEIFIVGALLAMAIVHFILFILSTGYRSYLLLSSICFIIGIRALIYSHLLPDIFQSVSAESWKKLEFSAVYSLLIIFPYYIKSIFQSYLNRTWMLLFVVVGFGMILLVLFTEEIFYTKFLNIFHVLISIQLLIALYTIWVNRKKKVSASIIFWAIFFSFPFFLIEFINNSGILKDQIRFGNLVETGMLVFLSFQCYLLSFLNSKAQTQLQSINSNLEAIMREKTFELSNSNDVKTILLSVISDHIRNPINSVKDLVSTIKTESIKRVDFVENCGEIENKLTVVSHLTDNILFWAAAQAKGFEIKKTTVNINQIVNEHINMFADLSKAKNILFINKVKESDNIEADYDVLCLALRNIVANAVKFSNDNGEISFWTTNDGENITLAIKDFGVGMDPVVSGNIFGEGQDSLLNILRTKNEGSGIGLKLCKKYLEGMGSRISFETYLNVGTTFMISKLKRTPG